MVEVDGLDDRKGKPLRRIRRSVRKLSGLLSRHGDAGPVDLDRESIRQVLIVRANGRMGNTLFLTPLLAAIHELLPDALIDVFVTYPDAADVLAGTAGLRRVMTLPHKGWWRVGDLRAALKAFREHRYDLVIDPTAGSSSNRLALALCRARWRVGFGDEDGWLRLDRSADCSLCDRHEALRPLDLLQQVLGYEAASGRPRLRVANSAEELAAGARLLAERVARAARQPPKGSPVIGFFASARGKKDLGPDWWRAFWEAYLALEPGTAPIEVLPAAEQPPIDPQFATVHCRSPRILAATVAHADWFFSADTGPMHLASAAGTPTIAFFNRTDPAAFRPINASDVVLGIGNMTPQEVAEACARLVANRARTAGGQDRGPGPHVTAAGQRV